MSRDRQPSEDAAAVLPDSFEKTELSMFVGDAREDLPEAIRLGTEPEPPFEYFRRLLENDHLQPIANAGDVLRWLRTR